MHHKPNSVPCGSDHLSGTHVTMSLERHSHNNKAMSTALHRGKDFAVAPHMSPYRLIFLRRYPLISLRASLFAPLGLPRRALPATLLHAFTCLSSDFPRFYTMYISAIAQCTYILYHITYSKKSRLKNLV